MTAELTSKSGRHSLLRAIAWSAVVLGALVFQAGVDQMRIARVDYVSGTASWSVDPLTEDPLSPTGYAGQQRQLIVPGHHSPSYRWIMATQRMMTAGQWHQHHLDYENFPAGYESRDTSPYRCWLALVAWVDHLVARRSLPLAVEHAALYADPLLHGLLIFSVALFASRYCGKMSAAAAALALVGLFPLAGAFQPGAPDAHALAWVCALGSVLALLAGFLGGKPSAWAIVAGLAGGLTLWTERTVGEPVLLGTAIGAIAAIFLGGRSILEKNLPALPWRLWGLAGGSTCLIAYLLEYFPPSPEWSASSIHPLHAAAFLGWGELIHQLTQWSKSGKISSDRRTLLCGIGALSGVAALPAARIFSENSGFLADDPFASELVNLASGTRAPHLWAWISREGLTPALGAVCLPLGVAGLAFYFLFSRRTPALHRGALTVALGPALVVLALAGKQLRWWNGFDAMSVVLVVIIVAVAEQSASRAGRWLVRAGCLLVALPGIFLLVPPAGSRGSDPLGEIELQGVVERDLAHWLTRQRGSEPSVVFTTPGLTETLTYYGNIKGVASYDPENRSGFSAAVRIASASTWTEAALLLEGRGITHLILPSWDPTFNQLVQLGRQLSPGSTLPRNTLVANLQNWELPPWLQLMTYHAPQDVGPGNLGATVLALREPQDEIIAVSRRADFFLEMGLVNEAGAIREKLRLYPRSVPAMAALAQIDLTLGDAEGYRATLESLLPYVSRRAGRPLPVDRRISLAALLIQAKQQEAAREQMQQCVAELNATRIRELTTGQLVRLLAMNDLLGLTLSDAHLRSLALSLLPPSLRARLIKPTD